MILNLLTKIHKIFNYPKTRIEPKLCYEIYAKEKNPKSLNELSKFRQNRLNWILPLIHKSSTVLDIACGDGLFLKKLEQEKQITGTACDCIENKTLENFIKGDCSDLAFLESLDHYDHILALEILEHLPNSEEVILTLLKKAKHNLIFSIPNSGYITYRLRYLFGRTPAQWISHPAEHLRFWSITDCIWWLKALGISNYKIIPYKGIKILNRIFPNIFAKGIIVEIKK